MLRQARTDFCQSFQAMSACPEPVEGLRESFSTACCNDTFAEEREVATRHDDIALTQLRRASGILELQESELAADCTVSVSRIVFNIFAHNRSRILAKRRATDRLGLRPIDFILPGDHHRNKIRTSAIAPSPLDIYWNDATDR